MTAAFVAGLAVGAGLMLPINGWRVRVWRDRYEAEAAQVDAWRHADRSADLDLGLSVTPPEGQLPTIYDQDQEPDDDAERRQVIRAVEAWNEQLAMEAVERRRDR